MKLIIVTKYIAIIAVKQIIEIVKLLKLHTMQVTLTSKCTDKSDGTIIGLHNMLGQEK